MTQILSTTIPCHARYGQRGLVTPNAPASEGGGSGRVDEAADDGSVGQLREDVACCADLVERLLRQFVHGTEPDDPARLIPLLHVHTSFGTPADMPTLCRFVRIGQGRSTVLAGTPRGVQQQQRSVV